MYALFNTNNIIIIIIIVIINTPFPTLMRWGVKSSLFFFSPNLLSAPVSRLKGSVGVRDKIKNNGDTVCGG